MTRVSLVMPVHNRRDTTLQALGSLSRMDTRGLDIEIIVVDDGSIDGTADAIRRRFPATRVIAGDGTLYYAGGTNRGLEAALRGSPDYVVAMNDDSIFHESFLTRLIACAEQHPKSVVGALLLLWNEPHRVFQVATVWDTWFGGWRVPQRLDAFNVPSEAWEVQTLAGNCVLYPAAALREAGLMNARRFPFGWGGDVAFMARVRQAGWRLLVEPRARVWCQPNTYPTPLGLLPRGQAMRALFVDRRHPLNLRGQFALRWESAPSRFHAVTAFAIYTGRLGLKAVGLGGTWPRWPDPRWPDPK